MIPLKDVDHRPLRFPLVTVAIILVNIFVFLLELAHGEGFILKWSFVPSEITSGRDLITVFTAMFIHGGLLHIAGNMIYLWAFGPEIEDIMGRRLYPVFYLSGGLLATFAQVAMSPASSVPSLGASGAIAAVMGAFLITFPRDRIRTILFLGWFVMVPLVPAILLVGFWFVIQLLSEVGSLVHRQTGGVAYVAHIGGFVFGMASVHLFARAGKAG